MKNYLFLGLFCLHFGTFAQLTTIKPHVERQSSRETRISKVEITGNETLIYLTFRSQASIGGGIMGEIFGNRLFFDPSPESTNTISINPASYLIDPSSKRRFRFIRASGIPVLPQEQRVQPEQTVRFVVAYEKLDAGIELVDLFEGQNNGKSRRQYWNFYGIEVNNPKDNTNTEEKLPDVRPKETPKAVLPNLLIVKGKLLNAKTEQPITGKIVYRLNNSSIDSLQTDAQGNYSFSLRPNAYSYQVSAKGYTGIQEEIDLSRVKSGQFTQNIYLNPIEINTVIPLENIKFEASKSNLLSDSYAELDKLVTMMKESPSMSIRLEGHTDNVGDPAKNKALSIDRVFVVRQYLIKKGIDGKRVQFVGYGGTKPIADNSTEAGRSQNRRVEMVILSQ